jgi:pyridoxamine 5'-phosphate oxidase
MPREIEQIRVEGIDEKTIDPDPIKQFKSWFAEAINARLPLPEAMTLATATSDGKPTARMVLLKQVDESGFVFFTNYRSAKADVLARNKRAALVFFWPQLERQVRVEGTVSKTSTEESAAYFSQRPRKSQIGAWASPQSEVIANREVLDRNFEETEDRYRDREIECPDYWGGYRVNPERIEFWKGRVGRLHDRIVFERTQNGWDIKRLAP